jgi:NADH-quinone oxidoreductase subunit E
MEHRDDRVDLKPAEEILAQTQKTAAELSHGTPNYLIPILQKLREAYGYLPVCVLEWMSEQTGIPASRVYGVVSFYAQFYLEPQGRHTVRCCRGTSCHVRGGRKVLNAVQRNLGIKDGETSDDMLFSLQTVACLGACALSPVMIINDTYYGKVTSRRVEQILGQIREEEH